MRASSAILGFLAALTNLTIYVETFIYIKLTGQFFDFTGFFIPAVEQAGYGHARAT
jgi:hypothetical protein